MSDSHPVVSDSRSVANDSRAVVLQILADLFADRVPDGLDALRDDTELQPTFDLDSMDVVDIAMELENRLGVEIDATPAEVRTLGALVAEVERRR